MKSFFFGESSNVRKTWEDNDDKPLELNLDDIVTEFIVSGERRYREASQRRYDWQLQSKADLIEKIRKRKEEAERQERERRIRLEKERVDRLLSDASALRQADAIRAYVEAVRSRSYEENWSLTAGELENWAEWALAQAHRIDPVRSGSFPGSTKDLDKYRETEGS